MTALLTIITLSNQGNSLEQISGHSDLTAALNDKKRFSYFGLGLFTSFPQKTPDSLKEAYSFIEGFAQKHTSCEVCDGRYRCGYYWQ